MKSTATFDAEDFLLDPLSRLWFRACVFAVVLMHKYLPEILCIMMNPVLTVCILWHFCPVGYFFKFQIKGLSVTWLALIVSRHENVPWLLAVGSWYWSDFNMDNCLCHINPKKQASVGWHGHLCSMKLLDCKDL